MNKNIYYGEYTLKHWIDLILNGDIVLPPYQRSFVWSKNQVEKFLGNYKKGLFVPPVIIGAFNDEGSNKNLIIDGQQRLTSILLGYLGYFPKPEEFHPSDEQAYSPEEESFEPEEIEDGEVAENSEEAENDEVAEWTYITLTNNGEYKTRLVIIENLENNKYVDIINNLDEEFLNNTYLGFSYIVPIESEETEQQRFYSNVFHDINLQGVALQGQESRRSLYYLNKNLVPFFEPAISNKFKLYQNSKPRKYDYVRALSFLMQYKKESSERYIAKGCRSFENLELYYEDFINSVINSNETTEDSRFGKFSILIGEENITTRNELLESHVSALHFNERVFDTIIDADVHLFGLIYVTIFLGKTIPRDKIEQLNTELTVKVSAFKGDENHKKAPNALKYLRNRIKTSIEIYTNCIDEH